MEIGHFLALDIWLIFMFVGISHATLYSQYFSNMTDVFRKIAMLGKIIQ